MRPMFMPFEACIVTIGVTWLIFNAMFGDGGRPSSAQSSSPMLRSSSPRIRLHPTPTEIDGHTIYRVLSHPLNQHIEHHDQDGNPLSFTNRRDTNVNKLKDSTSHSTLAAVYAQSPSVGATEPYHWNDYLQQEARKRLSSSFHYNGRIRSPVATTFSSHPRGTATSNTESRGGSTFGTPFPMLLLILIIVVPVLVMVVAGVLGTKNRVTSSKSSPFLRARRGGGPARFFFFFKPRSSFRRADSISSDDDSSLESELEYSLSVSDVGYQHYGSFAESPNSFDGWTGDVFDRFDF